MVRHGRVLVRWVRWYGKVLGAWQGSRGMAGLLASGGPARGPSVSTSPIRQEAMPTLGTL